MMVSITHAGRSLIEGETDHHINGLNDDNRPDNLELGSDRSRRAFTCAMPWRGHARSSPATGRFRTAPTTLTLTT